MPDPDSLRDRIAAALDASMDNCARCKTCDTQADAVMTVLQEAGVFPEGAVTEWGVRFDRHEDGRSFTDAYQGEVSARTSALNPDPDLANHGWTGTVVRRKVTQWTEVPAPETAKEGGEDG